MIRPKQTPMMIPIVRLISNPNNPRKLLTSIDDLARSIRSQGILQPLLVTHAGPATFKVLAGHRRLEAAKVAGLQNVPCVVRDGVEPTDEAAIMLIENMQRVQLEPVEKAEAIAAIIGQGYTQTDVARMLGVTPTTINVHLGLLELDEDSLDEIRAGNLPIGDARAQARSDQRKQAGKPTRGRPIHVDPPHFTTQHPLAHAVAELCTHTTRPKIARTGCGQCWEATIREDERRTTR